MVKVGDRIRVLIDGANCANVKKGDEFIVRRAHPNGSVNVEDNWSFTSDNYEVIHAEPFKNPIEYLKSAHADGDMIDPATMLRECYGITKTERVVVEWSVAKREIKVGDRVRIVGNKYPTNNRGDFFGGLSGHGFQIGDVVTIKEIDHHDQARPYYAEGEYGWLSPDDVELI